MSGDVVEPAVLVLSNGYGEDTIAAGIVEHLIGSVNPPRVMAMPLVGAGQAYARLGVEIVGPRRLMPSGGLILAGWTNILTDIKAGFWKMTADQMGTLKRMRGHIGALVAVGDTVPVLMGALCARQRVIFVGTAKSNYFYPYSSFERAVFKRYCDVVFARDEATAATLREHGIGARWVGNAMMDSLGLTDDPLPLEPGTIGVGLLPGSRKVAYRDLPVILDAARRLGEQRKITYLMALPDSLELDDLAKCARACGWELQGSDRLVGSGQTVLLVRGRFGDVVKHSSVVIGQAGTGNEQAVGMGKPVVSFDSDGRRTPGWYRARQKGLLGDSLSVVERSGEAIAAETLHILDDAALYATMQKAGYERMGPPGASQKIASYIIEHLQEKSKPSPAYASIPSRAATSSLRRP